MNKVKRAEAFEEFVNDQREIMKVKNVDYSAGMVDQNANANFHEVANLLKGAPITPYTVCMVYYLKHVFSLITFTKTGHLESEGIRGRHLDASNYSFILDTLKDVHVEWIRRMKAPPSPFTTELGRIHDTELLELTLENAIGTLDEFLNADDVLLQSVYKTMEVMLDEIKASSACGTNDGEGSADFKTHPMLTGR